MPPVAPVRRILRRERPVKRILLAKTAIAGNHVWCAIFDRIVYALPLIGTAASFHDGAPWRVVCEARQDIGARDQRECSDWKKNPHRAIHPFPVRAGFSAAENNPCLYPIELWSSCKISIRRAARPGEPTRSWRYA